MSYWMYAIREDKTINNHKGDSGGMSMALWRNEETGEIEYENNAKPRVGVAMRVGSITGRSYSYQDWWQTTPIKRIVKEWETDDGNEHVIFETQNGSTYHWKSY